MPDAVAGDRRGVQAARLAPRDRRRDGPGVAGGSAGARGRAARRRLRPHLKPHPRRGRRDRDREPVEQPRRRGRALPLHLHDRRVWVRRRATRARSQRDRPHLRRRGGEPGGGAAPVRGVRRSDGGRGRAAAQRHLRPRPRDAVRGAGAVRRTRSRTGRRVAEPGACGRPRRRGLSRRGSSAADEGIPRLRRPPADPPRLLHAAGRTARRPAPDLHGGGRPGDRTRQEVLQRPGEAASRLDAAIPHRRGGADAAHLPNGRRRPGRAPASGTGRWVRAPAP